jgi:hypothetical protein
VDTVNFRSHSLGDPMNKSAVTNPGPGAYNSGDKSSKYKSDPAYGLGSAKRQGLASSATKQVPGPGTYATPSKAVEGPKFIMGSRYEHGGIFKNNANPGPGTHEPDPKRT